MDLEDEDNSINFIHRTYAEFFVAQFLIEIIFVDGVDKNAEQDEIMAIVMVLNILLVEIKDFRFALTIGKGEKYLVVKEFLYSFIKRNKSEVIIGIKNF